jgi:hypothetical protein
MRYICIPEHVYNDKSICNGAKLLYGEITALCENNSCRTSGAYLAGLLNAPENDIQNWICQLQKSGHIKTEKSISGKVKLKNSRGADEFVLYASFT